MTGQARRRRRHNGVGKVGARARARAPAPAISRSSRSTRCRCTAAWTSARRSRRPTERAEVPHHLIDLVEPDEEFTVARFQRDVRRRARGDRSAWSPRPSRRRHRPLPARRDRRAHHSRSLSATHGATLDEEPTDVLHERLRALDPVGATRVTADQPAAHRPRPRSHDRQRPSVLVVRSWTRGLPADAVPSSPASRCLRAWWPPASRPATAGSSTTASSTRCAGCSHGREDCLGPRRQALGYKELAAHLAGRRHAGRGHRPGGASHTAVRPPAAGVVPPRPTDRMAPRRDGSVRGAGAALEQIVSGAAP